MEQKSDTNVSMTEGGDTVKILLKTQGQRKVCCQMNRSCQLERLFRTFCTMMDLDYRFVEFLHNGHRVFGSSSPDQLDLDEAEADEGMIEIDAFVRQMGGCPRRYEGREIADFSKNIINY
ncbi:uncharacterized protein LOC116196319 [Punica granatum]|uniref:Uncharacterized protein LOC116189836 n=2 Tax=Punica granatum TaxID=22663 RepID=A0A6P8C0U6_PUNGR|nr:uncharacterized protein LOC116189836 [Punica granatum]XP_031381844.1 uncharacterized protein LOC116196319 [Punica granatum]OWM89938.1 hypothetical protein CDL15_Pgr012575 [Punica granatum]PKI50823.1 hypothetical protein CRG98_028818 [Punica granatum]